MRSCVPGAGFRAIGNPHFQIRVGLTCAGWRPRWRRRPSHNRVLSASYEYGPISPGPNGLYSTQRRGLVSTPLAPPLDGGAEQLSRRAWGTLLVLCGALFLDALDVSMIGVALPSIRNDLHLSTSSLQWVVSAYVLGYGGC